jgi:hypothetical protein
MPAVALMPPTMPAPRSLTRSPYRLPITSTSNWCGRDTSCMQQLSTISSRVWNPGNSRAAARNASRNSPSASLRMFALWTQATLLRPASRAQPKAKRRKRRQAASVTTLMLCTTPGTISCSMAAYRSSVNSRMTSMSTSWKRAGRPRRFFSGRTEANRPNSRRKRMLKLPSPGRGARPAAGRGGDSSFVFRARPVSRTERSISGGSGGFPSCTAASPARCSSQSTATPAAARTRFTAGTWSNPMPPPCTSVTRSDMLSAPPPSGGGGGGV